MTDTSTKIDHPKHYNQHPSGVECIDIVEELPFNIGTAIKHLWRAGLKPNEPMSDDLRKAAWYVQRELDRQKRLKQRADEQTPKIEALEATAGGGVSLVADVLRQPRN